VLSPKGGSGGSTVASNIAAALAATTDDHGAGRSSGPVALVDADLQFGDLPLLLGVDPGPSLVVGGPPGSGVDPAAVEGVNIARLLVAVPGLELALLPAPVDPVLSEIVTPGAMVAAVDALGERFATVVIDLPTRLDDLAADLVAASRHLVVVTSTDLPAVKDTAVALNVLRRLGVTDATWSLVCNRCGEAGGLSPSEVGSHLGLPVRHCIPDDPSVPRAGRRGRPVIVDAPGAPAARALQSLADVLSMAEAPHGSPTGGWPARSAVSFGRWLSPLDRLRTRVVGG
jgi:pilus assembly protein CpaE